MVPQHSLLQVNNVLYSKKYRTSFKTPLNYNDCSIVLHTQKTEEKIISLSLLFLSLSLLFLSFEYIYSFKVSQKSLT